MSHQGNAEREQKFYNRDALRNNVFAKEGACSYKCDTTPFSVYHSPFVGHRLTPFFQVMHHLSDFFLRPCFLRYNEKTDIRSGTG